MLSTLRVISMDTLFSRKPADEFAAPQTAAPQMASLLAAAREGDRQSIGELLQHYRNYLMALAASQIESPLRPRVSPSDVVQEAMLRAARHFAQFQGASEKELIGWLRQILATSLSKFVEQHVLAAKRDVRKEFSIEQFGAACGEFTGGARSVLDARAETPSAAVQRSEDAALLEERLAQLPSMYREVLVLRNLQGLAFEEIAERMERSPGAVRMLWLRAIERLRAVYRRSEEHDL